MEKEYEKVLNKIGIINQKFKEINEMIGDDFKVGEIDNFTTPHSICRIIINENIPEEKMKNLEQLNKINLYLTLSEID